MGAGREVCCCWIHTSFWLENANKEKVQNTSCNKIEHYGGKVIRAPEIVHGKASSVTHRQTGVFESISHPLPVARYHSLVASNVPSALEIIAEYETADQINLPMAIEHKSDAALGFQFHPESILTTYGGTLLAQTIDYLLATNHKNKVGASHE